VRFFPEMCVKNAKRRPKIITAHVAILFSLVELSLPIPPKKAQIDIDKGKGRLISPSSSRQSVSRSKSRSPARSSPSRITISTSPDPQCSQLVQNTSVIFKVQPIICRVVLVIITIWSFPITAFTISTNLTPSIV